EGGVVPLHPASQPRPLGRLANRSPLPRDLPAFTDREQSTRELAEVIANGERLAVLSGQVGVGKSALAVHVAHELSEAFPDGCFFVRLRAEDGAGRAAHQVLAQLLRTVAASGAVSEPDDLTVSWERWLATHRALVVLDDARRAADVRHLIPGT